MNPLHQLTRRPVKAAFGVLLLALAGAILCLSGGQYWAAAQTRATVERTYTTVAVITGLGSSEENGRQYGRGIPAAEAAQPGPLYSFRRRSSRAGTLSAPARPWAWSADTAPA